MDVSELLGPLTPIGSTWYDTTLVERGRVHGRNFPSTPPTGTALDTYTGNHYYDLGLAMRVAHERAKDSEFLALFRKVCDSWWLTPNWIESGNVRDFDNRGPTPRNAGILGLIIRALDGRPEMWDWITAYTRYQFNNWLKVRVNDPQLYLGVRDGAFMLQYAAWLAALHPDAAIRAGFLADIELVTMNYFAGLQQSDGSWRWDDPYYQSNDGGQLQGVTQPFQVGLLHDALIDVYKVTSNETVKAAIVNAVTKSCRHLYSGGPYSTQRLSALNINLRGFHYFYHGGTTVNPARYERGDLPVDWNPTNPSDVQNQRQPIGLLVASYGWCWKVTGDEFFKTAGDDLWDAAYGPTDGIHNYMAGDVKSYNQNARSAGKYLGYVGGSVSQPLPSEPIPTIPTQPTTPTPSPDGTKASTIVDSQGITWTLEATTKRTLRNGTWVGSGQGEAYKYLNTLVYVLGLDSNWYQWIGSGWMSVGTAEPGGVTPVPQPIPTPTPMPTPTPTPTPVPEPVPAPLPTTRTISYPAAKQIAKRNSVLDLQWAERFRLKKENADGTATFEKVV